MNQLIEQFFTAFTQNDWMKTVFTGKAPKEMMASPVDKEGWFEWKLIEGTLQPADYQLLEDEFKVKFPPSFIEWHRAYFFLRMDCEIVRLPSSNPLEPLREIRVDLDWYIPKQLIPQRLYPFGSTGDDAGPLVFDGREEAPGAEFPIRAYDQDYGGDPEGLSEVIFSSFPKALECLTHFLREEKSRQKSEIILDFFQIDGEGAGRTGIDYWLLWASGFRAESEVDP